MKSPITAVPSLGNRLVASNISRPGRNEICVQQLEQQDQNQNQTYSSNIEFQNDESVTTFRWIRQDNKAVSATSASTRKRRNSDSVTSVNGDAAVPGTDKFTDCLVILLATGEILIYSTSTREFVNKISTDSPFSAIEVIDKIGKSKKALASYDYDLIAFDAAAPALKFFSSSSPQLVDSVPFKVDNAISYILFNQSVLEQNSKSNVELILASSVALYLLDPSHEVVQTIDIAIPISTASSSSSPAKGKNSKSKAKSKSSTPAPASNESSEPSSILKIVKNGSLLYIVRTDSPIVQVVDIEAKESYVRHTITASNSITDVTLLNVNKSVLLSATLTDGSIELFQTDDESSFAKLEIEGGSDVGRFVGLLNSDNVIDGVYKGIWYDNFNVQITDFEFENISKLKGTISISVTELADPTEEIIDLGDDDEEEEGEEVDVKVKDGENDGEGEEQLVEKAIEGREAISGQNGTVHDPDTDVAMDNTAKDYKCGDLTKLTDMITLRLVSNKDGEVYDEELAQILAQNADQAKPAIYLLSARDSVALFSKVAFIISQYQSQSLNQDFGFVSSIKAWLKWLLVLRGAVLSENEESVGWLRLLQSTFKQEARTLDGMVKLTGKLSLLRDQLIVRREMMGRGVVEDDAEDDTALDETTFGEDNAGNSVVLDGEGGFEDDEEPESNNDVDNTVDNNDPDGQ